MEKKINRFYNCLFIRFLNFVLKVYLFIFFFSFASAAPEQFTFEGYLTNASGEPITNETSAIVKIYYDNNSSCVLYQEKLTITPDNKDGFFSFQFGSYSEEFKKSFNKNKTNLDCQSGTISNPNSEARTLGIELYNGTAYEPMNQRVQFSVVGNALRSEYLGDKKASDFILNPQCSVDQVLKFDGSTFVCKDDMGIGSNYKATEGSVWYNSGSKSIQFNDGVNTKTLGVAGSGISMFNGITLANQTLGVPTTSGSSLSWTSTNAGVHTLNIPLASQSSLNPGLLSNSDFLSFSNKLNSAAIFSGDVTGSFNSLTLVNIGTSGTYRKVTVDSKGRVTSGVQNLSLDDIPNLSWSKITTGKPTSITGYGITDAISNAGATPSISAGLELMRPLVGATGQLYIATDTNKIYRYNGSSWSPLGMGGYISSLTGDVTATGPISGGAAVAVIADNSINNSKIVDFSISTNKIAEGAIISSKIGNGSITTEKLFAIPASVNGPYLVGTTNDGTALKSLACGVNNQVLRWTATGWGCVDVSTLIGFTPLNPTAIATDLKMNSNTIYGSSVASGNLTLDSTSDLTSKGAIILGTGATKVGIGTSTPSSVLDVVTSTSVVASFTGNGGSCTVSPTGGGLSCSSDERLKKDFLNVSDSWSLEKILSLQVGCGHGAVLG